MAKKSQKSKNLRVFYSWQSDLPESVNAQLIRSALSAAATMMSEDEDLKSKVYVDEATRDTAGSPNIARAIFEKIEQADVFVCDVTKITEFLSGGETRKCCNPNVAIELGYAIHELGWERIILVFNLAYGKLPADLPFDVQAHRAAKYRCELKLTASKVSPETKVKIANEKGVLRELFATALRTIIEKNPLRPAEVKKNSPAGVKRAQDVLQLKELFHWIHLRVIDRFFDTAELGRLTDAGYEFWRGLRVVTKSTEFHFHDATLERLAINFVTSWGRCFEFIDYMEYNPQRNDYHFHMPMDMHASLKRERQHTLMMSRRLPASRALDELLRYVRSSYLEIDPRKTGKEALIRYREQADIPF